MADYHRRVRESEPIPPRIEVAIRSRHAFDGPRNETVETHHHP